MSFLSMLRNNPTKKESKIRRKLEHNKLGFIFQQPVRINNKPIIVDFYHPSKKIIIEIDGNSHKNLLKDIYRDYGLLQQGYLVLRYNNDQKSSLIINDIKSHVNSNHTRKTSLKKLNKLFNVIFKRYFFQSKPSMINIDIINKQKFTKLSGWKAGNNKRTMTFKFLSAKNVVNEPQTYIKCRTKRKTSNFSNEMIFVYNTDKLQRAKNVYLLINELHFSSGAVARIYNISRSNVWRLWKIGKKLNTKRVTN